MRQQMLKLTLSAVAFLTVGLTPAVHAAAKSQASTGSFSHGDVEVQIAKGFPLVLPTMNETSGHSGQTLATNARSAVVMDYTTGQVLFSKDHHERLPMASITKIMTMLLIMEAVDGHQLKLTDRVKASEYASSMGGSQIFLEPGETMSVEEMLKGIAIASANDACVAMAEHLFGSEQMFVKRMNERAKELGMNDTHFVNCNGLPAEDHYSSAHDIAVMSRELLKHSQITRWTSVYSDYLRKGTDEPLWLVNTNKLVRFYPGVDGLKTGYTTEAKYCLSATAKRGPFRAIVVVLGEPKSTTRNAEVSQLLNWLFSQYESEVLYQSGQKVAELNVPHGIPRKVAVVTADPVGVIHAKGAKVEYKTHMKFTKSDAPLHVGEKIGTLIVEENGKPVGQVALISSQTIRRANLFESIWKTVGDIARFGKNA